jgi:hypothetical protein
MYVQSSYSFQALLYTVVILNDPQSPGISHWVTYCTASACTGLFPHHLLGRLKSLSSALVVRAFVWLHTFLYGYTYFYLVTHIFIWLDTFLCDYTHFYMVTYILYGYAHLYMVTYIFILLYTFLYGYIHFCMVIYIFIWLYAFFGCRKECHGKSWQQISCIISTQENNLQVVKWPQATGAIVDSEKICTSYVLTEEKLDKSSARLEMYPRKSLVWLCWCY